MDEAEAELVGAMDDSHILVNKTTQAFRQSHPRSDFGDYDVVITGDVYKMPEALEPVDAAEEYRCHENPFAMDPVDAMASACEIVQQAPATPSAPVPAEQLSRLAQLEQQIFDSGVDGGVGTSDLIEDLRALEIELGVHNPAIPGPRWTT